MALPIPLLLACAAPAAPPPAASGVPTTGVTDAAPSPASGPVELTVYAAASLRRALEAASDAYQSVAPEVTMVVSTDSSTTLRTQIEQGAPADLFLSADTTNPERLAAAGKADGDPIAFAANQLSVVVPASDPGGITTPADLARAGVRVIAAGPDVPITRYAEQLVANLGSLPGYPADFAAAYAANIVSREDNVANVVGKLALGEGDAGIVYATDAAARISELRSIPVPPEANVSATYAGAVVAGAAHAAEARAFLDWLRGEEGQASLTGLGFAPAP